MGLLNILSKAAVGMSPLLRIRIKNFKTKKKMKIFPEKKLIKIFDSHFDPWKRPRVQVVTIIKHVTLRASDTHPSTQWALAPNIVGQTLFQVQSILPRKNEKFFFLGPIFICSCELLLASPADRTENSFSDSIQRLQHDLTHRNRLIQTRFGQNARTR